jgi:hypothetical protein
LVGRRTAAVVRSLPERALIDRLVRGRAWIPVLGVMLAGIVAMQVEVLKLGASVGRSIESSSALQTRNELLRASVASLSDEARIERLAAGMGMIMPAPGSAGFLSGADVSQAIANIHAPNPSGFLTATGSNGSVATSGIMSSSDGSIAALLPGQASSGGAGGAGTTSSLTSGGGTTGTGGATSTSTPASTATTSAAATAAGTTTSPATTSTAATSSGAATASSGGAATSQSSGTPQSTTTGG